MAAQRKALGRGLSALLGTTETETEQVREVDVDRILPNGQQPRKNFAEESLNELADSIRTHGVIQPIVVQPLQDNFFQIIAGERRWRASQRAGLVRIPVVIREIGAESSLEIALIENLQREDLNPIEEALAYEKLIVDYGLTQDDVARRVGKGRATIANMLRLLRLPPEVQQWISETKLSTGHAKALLALSELGTVVEAARKIIQAAYPFGKPKLSYLDTPVVRSRQNLKQKPFHKIPTLSLQFMLLSKISGLKSQSKITTGKGVLNCISFPSKK